MSAELRVTRLARPLSPETEARLKSGIQSCSDVAFAYLAQVQVPERQEEPGPVLFVWLRPAALSAVHAALNLVCQAVAKAITDKTFLDVVVLNSASELLPTLEQAGCLLTEVDREERQRALWAADHPEAQESQQEPPRGWWPF